MYLQLDMMLEKAKLIFSKDLGVFFTFAVLLTQDEKLGEKLVAEATSLFLCSKIDKVEGEQMLRISVLSLIYSCYTNLYLGKQQRISHLIPQHELFYDLTVQERAIMFLHLQHQFSFHQIANIIHDREHQVRVEYEKCQMKLLASFQKVDMEHYVS